MAPFRPFFTAPVFEHALVLLMGAMLAPGKRTVSAALRITGRAAASSFTCYHQVLNRTRWSSLAVARRLLVLIIDCLVPDGPVVIGVDDTIERRWGPKIAARGIYRDPVRSSHAHFVKTSGLRWLMVLCLLIGGLTRFALLARLHCTGLEPVFLMTKPAHAGCPRNAGQMTSPPRPAVTARVSNSNVGCLTYQCARCREQTFVTAGTVLHGRHLPLKVWFLAA